MRKSRNFLLKDDQLWEEVTKGDKAFYIFGPWQCKVKCLMFALQMCNLALNKDKTLDHCSWFKRLNNRFLRSARWQWMSSKTIRGWWVIIISLSYKTQYSPTIFKYYGYKLIWHRYDSINDILPFQHCFSPYYLF